MLRKRWLSGKIKTRVLTWLSLFPLYFVAMLLGLAPPDPRGVLSASFILLVTFPISLALFIFAGFFTFPESLLNNLGFEPSDRTISIFTPFLLLALISAHVWFLRTRLHVAFAVLSLLLLASAYNCGDQITTI